jgi:hypothetical protein
MSPTHADGRSVDISQADFEESRLPKFPAEPLGDPAEITAPNPLVDGDHLAQLGGINEAPDVGGRRRGE